MQNLPLQIGITGGIGTGKSIVCKIFAALGIAIYDADSHAKTIMTTDGILIDQIKKEFGSLSYDERGVLNRAYLAEKVFTDEEKLKKLNELVHPRVGINYRQWHLAQKGPYVVREAALLFESGAYVTCDKIIVVTAPLELRVKRILQRDSHRNRKQIEEIIGKQLPEENKIGRADEVIKNDENHFLIPQVLSLHQKFIQLFQSTIHE